MLYKWSHLFRGIEKCLALYQAYYAKMSTEDPSEEEKIGRKMELKERGIE